MSAELGGSSFRDHYSYEEPIPGPTWSDVWNFARALAPGSRPPRVEKYPGEVVVKKIHDAYIAAAVRVAGETEYGSAVSFLRRWDFTPDPDFVPDIIHESAITTMVDLRPDLKPQIDRMHNSRRVSARSPLVSAMIVVEKARLGLAVMTERTLNRVLFDDRNPEDDLDAFDAMGCPRFS